MIDRGARENVPMPVMGGWRENLEKEKAHK